nr:uncharacterized protein LOC128699824 isoform X1 [Cherax quadricarinatus]XP_053648574.1 uncharacterized protein LOC128699824 isoform X1 [Cherax quadricarinatus]
MENIGVDKTNTHDTLVFTLCTEIMQVPQSSWTKVLVRCLNHLQLTPGNFTTLRQVAVLATKLLKEVKEKAVVSAIERFSASIQHLLKDAPEPDPEPELQEENNKDKTALGVHELNNTQDSAMSTLMENTMIRRKRMLYNNQTVSDPEVISSEDSDGDRSPTKRLARSPSSTSVAKDSVNRSSPLTSCIEHNKELVAADQVEDATTVTLVNPPSDAEVEVTSNIAQDDGPRSADLFDLLSSSPQISSNSEHSRNSANTSLLSRSSKETESEGSTPVSIGRRRRNKKESSAGDTSEEETVLPPKVSRTSRSVSRGCPKRETRSSSQSSDNIQPSPSAETSQQYLERSSESVYLTPPSKETNSNSFTTPVQMASASDKKLHSLRSRKNAKTSSNTSEDRVSVEDTSESSSSGEILHQIAGKKARVNAKNTELSSQSSLSPKKTRSRSRVSTPSDDATPVRRSARIESSTASDSDKTPNTGRSASTDTGLRRSRAKKYSPTSSADDQRVRSTRQRGRSSNKQAVNVQAHQRNNFSKIFILIGTF